MDQNENAVGIYRRLMEIYDYNKTVVLRTDQDLFAGFARAVVFLARKQRSPEAISSLAAILNHVADELESKLREGE